MNSVYIVFTDGDHYDFAVMWLGAFTSREAAERAAKHESLDPDHTWDKDLARYKAQLAHYESRVPYYQNRFVEDTLDILDEMVHEVKTGMYLEANPYDNGKPCWMGESLADKIVELRDSHCAKDLRHSLQIEALVKTLDIYDDVHRRYLMLDNYHNCLEARPDAPARWREWTGSPAFVRDGAGMRRFRDILRTCARRILRDELRRHEPEAPSRMDYRFDPVDGKLHRRGSRHWVEEVAVDKEAAR